MAKVKNYNLNVTEVLDSDFKNAFPGIFNFTVGILILKDRQAIFQGPFIHKDEKVAKCIHFISKDAPFEHCLIQT